MTEEEACTTLEGDEYQLSCSAEEEETGDHEAGEVFEQAATAGTDVDQGATVTITVAKEKPEESPSPSPSTPSPGFTVDPPQVPGPGGDDNNGNNGNGRGGGGNSGDNRGWDSLTHAWDRFLARVG